MLIKSYLLLQQKRTSYCDWQSSGKIEVMDVLSHRRENLLLTLKRAQEYGHDSV